jgi:uncharacterized protein (TIGR01777 family)
MRVIITGATGFIGTALCRELHKDHEITALSRSADKAKQALTSTATVTRWDPKTLDGWEETVNDASVVINLAGENIASGRWTESKEKKILQSRLDATKAIVEAIKQADHKPQALVQASAIGYYGTRGDEILNEDSPNGAGFLADVCKQWENAILPLEELGVRLVTIRLGPVLGAEGGMMQKLLPTFRFFLGGHPGSGKQWLSWVHIDDVTGAIRFLIESNNAQGVYNLTSPNPVPASDFYHLLGKLMHRPALLPLPACLLKVLMGRMAEELLLSSLRVLPNRLLQAGHKFKYADPESALRYTVQKTK